MQLFYKKCFPKEEVLFAGKKVKDTFKKNTKLEVNEPWGGVGFKNHWFAAKYHLAKIHGIRFPLNKRALNLPNQNH